jgi:hypothetical protein
LKQERDKNTELMNTLSKLKEVVAAQLGNEKKRFEEINEVYVTLQKEFNDYKNEASPIIEKFNIVEVCATIIFCP